jgi:hypothetical protein
MASDKVVSDEEYDQVQNALFSKEIVTPLEFVNAFFILLSRQRVPDHVAVFFADRILDAGIGNIELLAAGTSALAGKTVGGKILKLTFDDGDALASRRVLGKPLLRVARVYHAELIEHPDLWRPVGLVVNEYAGWPGLPIPGDDGDLNQLINDLNQKHKVWTFFQKQVTGKDAEKLMKKATKALVQALLLDGRDAFIDIAEGLRELMSHGVYMVDPNSTNVAYDHNGLKIIDLGLSYTRPE